MHYCSVSDFWILCALRVNRVVFGSFLELQRRRSGKLAATSRCANFKTFQRRDVATSRHLVNRRKSQRATQRRDVPTSRRSRHFCFRMIKSTGDLILVFIEERTDGVGKKKQQQPKRSKRLCFLKTIYDL